MGCLRPDLVRTVIAASATWVVLAAGAAALEVMPERYRPSDPATVVMRLPARTDAGQRSFSRGEQLVLKADALQQRHEFAAALSLLDEALRETQRGRGAQWAASAHLMRAQLHLLAADAVRARPDCLAVLAGGEATSGALCLAQVLALQGRLDEARDLFERSIDAASGGAADGAGGSARAVAVWGHAIGAEIADRGGLPQIAEALLREALRIDPDSESSRVALSDLLLARGAAREALSLLEVPRPSPAVLVRRASALTALGGDAAPPVSAFRAVLALDARRGERMHLREEALLALEVERDGEQALALARANFAVQKELADVRLLARAAVAARSVTAQRELREWLHARGWRDARTEAWLRQVVT